MAEPWNLTAQEWSKVLASEHSGLKNVAEQLKRGEVLPWTKTLFELLKDSKTALDLGSGRGENSALLALDGKQTTLLDWSEENLDFSKNLYDLLGLKAEFKQGDITKPLNFADKSFDTVFSCGVLEYFSDEQLKKILQEALRVSKKNVIIMVPNAWSVFYRWGKWYMEKTKQWHWGGERPFSTLKPYVKGVAGIKVKEFSVGAKHSLTFLTMRGGGFCKRAITKIFNLTDHSKPSLFNQGYLLISIIERI